MPRRALTRIFLFTAICLAARFQCSLNSLGFSKEEATSIEPLPASEKLLRAVDYLLMEPGYAQARELAHGWKKYITAFMNDERRTVELETLVNDPTILGFLRDLSGGLAPVFEKETRRILDNYGNKAFKAWRLRTLAGKIVLSESAKRLQDIDTSVTRRDITARYVTIPISGTGFNFSFDAEWDVTRLPDFPLSQINSEFLFLQTDLVGNVLALTGANSIPDTAYRFMSGGKFIAAPYGVQHGLRVFATPAKEFQLILCYPFAGYAFYAVRGLIILLVATALIILFSKLIHVTRAATHVIENQPKKWLGDHYEQSLGMNQQALGLSDKTMALVSEIKERDAQIFRELGGHIKELSLGFATQTRQILDSASNIQATAQSNTQMPTAPRSQAVKQPYRPLHRSVIHKPAVIIESDRGSDINVAIELDLPLADEKQMGAAEKTTYLATLRRRAQAKTGGKDFIHDEKLDNYDYIPEAPMPMPERTADLKTPSAAAPDTEGADLEYVQKFRYAGKSTVLPMATPTKKQPTLAIKEDLKIEALTISEDE